MTCIEGIPSLKSRIDYVLTPSEIPSTRKKHQYALIIMGMDIGKDTRGNTSELLQEIQPDFRDLLERHRSSYFLIITDNPSQSLIQRLIELPNILGCILRPISFEPRMILAAYISPEKSSQKLSRALSSNDKNEARKVVDWFYKTD